MCPVLGKIAAFQPNPWRADTRGGAISSDYSTVSSRHVSGDRWRSYTPAQDGARGLRAVPGEMSTVGVNST